MQQSIRTLTKYFANILCLGRTLGSAAVRSGHKSNARFTPSLAAVLVGVLAILPNGPAVAQPADPGASEWVQGEKARVRLISTVTHSGDLPVLDLGLEVVLEEGWKTYWRSPGDAGVPPHIDWAGSGNFSTAELSYPAPKRFSYYDAETFGYSDRVIYPIAFTPEQAGRDISLKADVNILVCDDVCIPHEMALSLPIPSGQARTSDFANDVNQFASRVPRDGANAGLILEDAILAGTAETPILQVAFSADDPFVLPDLFVEGPEFVSFGHPTVHRNSDSKRVLMTVTATDRFGEIRDLALTSMPLTVTLLDGNRSMEAAIAPQFGADPVFDISDFRIAGSASVMSFAAILLLALIGGLILNLMPCVLPVLSIKILSLVSHGGGDPKQVRFGFLATSAGIISAFVVLALFLIGLKSAGMAVGWGIQFQEPAFIVTLILVLVLFAANMWGFFEIRLPGTVSDAAVAHSGGSSLSGQFFQGVFATVLATPCSAPFLGTAVGFALSRGAVDIFSVFVALGVGMAAPFLLIAFFPRAATRLPKPGAWMLTLKKVLALALIATAVWLLTVLGVQVSPLAASVIAGLMGLILVVIAVRSSGTRTAARGLPVAIIVTVAALAYATPVLLPPTTSIQTTEIRGNVEWVPFNRTEIAELVAAGNVVFVDVTAEWCITCQVNKRRVLNATTVSNILAEDGVVAMKADWTKPSDEIKVYLESFNRFGIPFNVVYGPGAPMGVTLPELLTDGAVLAALTQVGTGRDYATISNGASE
jgi:suppressor for copper-sensitivity B